MKKIDSISLGLIMLLIVATFSAMPSKAQHTFEKIVWFELDAKEDSVLFKPLSKAWKELWQWDANISLYGSPLMHYDQYIFSFANRTDNLWTLLHPKLIDGTLQVYSPYDPKSFGLGAKDDGEMRYPMIDKKNNETFLTSEKVRSDLGYCLGKLGYQSDLPLVTQWGDDSVVVLPDGTHSYVYPPRDYTWYADKDIIKYRVRMRIVVNKNGNEKKRIPESIAPVVNEIREGQVVGQKELFWLDFDELKPHLKKAYYFDSFGKPVSYLNFFNRKALKTRG